MKEFLSDGVAALQIEDVKGSICSAGSSQGVVLTLKLAAALSGDSLQKLLDGLRCHFHRLYLIRPWVSLEPVVSEQLQCTAWNSLDACVVQANTTTLCVCLSVCLSARFVLR